MAKNVRVLIISLDGGTWKVLWPMMQTGFMPNLKKLVADGTSGVLTSTLPPLTPAAWATFQTGVLPPKHGIYDFIQYQPGSYKPKLVSSHSLRQKTIWQILSESGKKVITVGVPLTYPPKEINGISISGIFTPNNKCQYTYPDSFKAELLDAIGDYRFVVSNSIFYLKGLEAFIEELIGTEKRRLEAFEYASSKLDWDVGIVQFQSLDNLQHVLWPLLDPARKEYSPEKWKKTGSFFRYIDESIGKLKSITPENTNLIIMSDHGFGPVQKVVYINKWLESQGYAKARSSLTNRLFLTSVKVLKALDLFKLRRYFLNIESRLSLCSASQSISIDWSETKAYMPMGTESCNIFINLKGREPQGSVPAEQYHQIRSQIKECLENLKDPDIDKPIIRKVYCREDFASDCPELTADIVIEPEDGYLFNRGLDTSTLFTTTYFGKDVVGCHCKDGIYVLNGPDLMHLGDGPGASIVDLPPTVLALMGIEPPSYFDGKVMNFAFQEHVTKKQLLHLGEKKPKEQRQESYSQEDEAILQQRLKDLGYL